MDEVIQAHFSLFDESCIWRQEEKIKHLFHSQGHKMVLFRSSAPTGTKISAVDWLICPFWTSPSCSREDLRVAHRALKLRVYGLRNPGHSFSPAVSIPTTTPRFDSVYTQMKQTSGLFSHSVDQNRRAAEGDECSLSDAHRSGRRQSLSFCSKSGHIRLRSQPCRAQDE